MPRPAFGGRAEGHPAEAGKLLDVTISRIPQSADFCKPCLATGLHVLAPALPAPWPDRGRDCFAQRTACHPQHRTPLRPRASKCPPSPPPPPVAAGQPVRRRPAAAVVGRRGPHVAGARRGRAHGWAADSAARCGRPRPVAAAGRGRTMRPRARHPGPGRRVRPEQRVASAESIAGGKPSGVGAAPSAPALAGGQAWCHAGRADQQRLRTAVAGPAHCTARGAPVQRRPAPTRLRPASCRRNPFSAYPKRLARIDPGRTATATSYPGSSVGPTRH